MNSLLKQITVIINDLNDISKAAIHHADILASYYKCDINLFFLGNKEDLGKLKKLYQKIKEIYCFSSYEEAVKSIEKKTIPY